MKNPVLPTKTNPDNKNKNKAMERLPVSLVSNWPTWVLDLEDDRKEFIKIPDNNSNNNDNDNGFVSPTSINELWQPLDLKQPEIRLAVGLHIRDGSIRHILPAIDLSYQNGKHRNRGLCTVPRAFCWLDFQATTSSSSNTMVPLSDLSLLLQTRRKDEETWSDLATTAVHEIENLVNSAIHAITKNPPEELGTGSHILHILCQGPSCSWIGECPKAGNELQALLVVVPNGTNMSKSTTTVAALHVEIQKTAAGSESEYLPDAYKPLFEDESLRREAFSEWKERMERRRK